MTFVIRFNWCLTLVFQNEILRIIERELAEELAFQIDDEVNIVLRKICTPRAIFSCSCVDHCLTGRILQPALFALLGVLMASWLFV